MKVNGVLVPLISTCRLLMLGTEATGIVTLAKPVVPVCPVAVNPMLVEFVVILVMVASLLTEHPVPHVV